MRQLILDLPHRPAFGREDFLVASSNETAVALVDAWPHWPAPVAVLVGPKGSGKSHLAEVWRAVSGAQRIEAAALCVEQLPDLAAASALVIEDLPGERLDERALFHLINLARAQGAGLLLTARDFPVRWSLEVPDLASRLKAAAVAVLEQPDDALLRAVLVKLFADRQLPVDEAVVGYLMRRMERSLAAAADIVAALDRAALEAGAPVSRQLARRVLHETGHGEDEGAGTKGNGGAAGG